MVKVPTGKTLQSLGYPQSPLIGMVIERCKLFTVDDTFLENLWRHPEDYTAHDDWADVAKAICDHKNPPPSIHLRPSPVKNKIWGEDLIDKPTIDQFYMACRLPVSVQGAQMPDGHVGYGICIGGVIGLDNAVCPNMVGVDIACRMRLSIFSDSLKLVEAPKHENILRRAIEKETAFGINAHFPKGDRRNDSVMDEDIWNELRWLKNLKDKAWSQLGSSGSGNHFCSINILKTDGIPELGLEAGEYLTLLTHSGSRGLGSQIAQRYIKIASEVCRISKEASDLSWLDLDTEKGQEYWEAMNFAGRYASANHRLIHEYVIKAAGLHPIAVIENHHNFAWKEEHEGRELIVHRKGATPAGAGVLGVIPGTMADVSHIVRGLGNPDSLNSASHGAGRRMSRTKAKQTINGLEVKNLLRERNVDLISAGLDESPQAYKTISEVMAAQRDLVETIGILTPRIVKMAPPGEKAED